MSEQIYNDQNPAFVLVSSELLKKTEELASKAVELQDRLLRMSADWDNSRKRMQKEKEEALKYAAEGLLEELLPVIDNFELGLQSAQSAQDAKSVAYGFQMVQMQLNQFLKDNGLESIDAVGQEFDPHLHDALGHHETTEHPEGTIMSQTRKGYKLKDRLMRPAAVFVAKSPESSAE